MRVRGLAFVGLMVGAFMASSVSGSSVQSAASSPAQLDSLFSSDAPESIHESKNQGTLDEPKAWPEANAWLHAQLSDAERDFLAMNVALSATAVPTSTPAPVNCDLNGALAAATVTESPALGVTVRFTLTQASSTFLTQFQAAVVSSISISSASSVSAATGSPVVVGSNVNTLVSFTFTANGANTAGAQLNAFVTQFNSAVSALRTNAAFVSVDTTFCPTALVVAVPTSAPTTLAPTTLAATTRAPTTVGASTAAGGLWCDTHPTACLNGGTCINGNTATSFTCSCQSGFIGSVCQFSLFGSNRRASSSTRGKSMTRPNVAVKPKSA